MTERWKNKPGHVVGSLDLSRPADKQQHANINEVERKYISKCTVAHQERHFLKIQFNKNKPREIVYLAFCSSVIYSGHLFTACNLC